MACVVPERAYRTELVAVIVPPNGGGTMANKKRNVTIGTIIAVAAIAVTFVVGVPGFQSVHDTRSAAAKTQRDNELNDRIDHRLEASPKLAEIIGKLDRIEGKVTEIGNRLSKMEGWAEGHAEKRFQKLEKTQADQNEENANLRQQIQGQTAIAKLIDPNRVLATIRAEFGVCATARRDATASTTGGLQECHSSALADSARVLDHGGDGD